MQENKKSHATFLNTNVITFPARYTVCGLFSWETIKVGVVCDGCWIAEGVREVMKDA